MAAAAKAARLQDLLQAFQTCESLFAAINQSRVEPTASRTRWAGSQVPPSAMSPRSDKLLQHIPLLLHTICMTFVTIICAIYLPGAGTSSVQKSAEGNGNTGRDHRGRGFEL